MTERAPCCARSSGRKHHGPAGTSSRHVLVQTRWLAVNMLLGFMGAALGWAISWRCFIDTALLAYLSGLTAQEAFDALDVAEFSQAGSILRIASSAEVQPDAANAEVFARCAAPWPSSRSVAGVVRVQGAEMRAAASAAVRGGMVCCRWLSAAYMTWALMGVRHRRSADAEGWAWVSIESAHDAASQGAQDSSSSDGGCAAAHNGSEGSQDGAVVASAIAELVANRLRQLDLECAEDEKQGVAARRFNAVAMASMGATSAHVRSFQLLSTRSRCTQGDSC